MTPGPLYHLESVVLRAPDGGPPPALAGGEPSAFGLKLGDPARTAPILAAEKAIVAAYGNEGRPFAKIAKRDVVVDRAAKTMAVTYIVEAGPKVRFGPLKIEGLASIDRGYVERRVKWRRGAVYDAREVEKTRKALVGSELFSTVRIDPGAPDSAGEVPMTVTLTERAPRSVGVGLDYDTSRGFGGRAFWEHRNLFGGAERLRLSTELAQARLAALARFRKPDVLATDQDLLAEAELANETPDPYDSKRLRAFTGLERHLGPELSVGAGVQLESAEVTQKALFDSVPSNIDYTLFGLPLFARRDVTDDLLNPTRGNRESLSLTPYLHVAGADLNFATFLGRASGYQKIDESGRFVAAGYVALGSILGESVERLPADKRLYAGGGGSVRGYGFQRVGPLASGDLPAGGTSSLELGGELRVKVTDTIGVVPFVDAGNVYKDSFPDLGSRLFVGAGLGLRYYTPIGPVRFDVAVPLDKRRSDRAFQIYISIGQAF